MSYSMMNQSHGLSYDETLFLSYQKVSKIRIACSYLKEDRILSVKGTLWLLLHSNN